MKTNIFEGWGPLGSTVSFRETQKNASEANFDYLVWRKKGDFWLSPWVLFPDASYAINVSQYVFWIRFLMKMSIWNIEITIVFQTTTTMSFLHFRLFWRMHLEVYSLTFLQVHVVWKSQKKFHFGKFLKTWSLRSNSVTRQVSFNRTKIGEKCQNSNATFWVIFKQCEVV